MSVRVFADGPFEAGSVLELDDAEAHYLARVRRRTIGDVVDVLDGRGTVARAIVESLGKRVARVRIEALAPAQPPPTLRLACALLDPKAMLEAITHATEFGAASITFLRCERSSFDAPGDRRVEAAIRAAQRQSGRAAPLSIHGPLTLEELVRNRHEGETWLLAEPAAQRPVGPIDPAALLLVGPEGGFTDAERQQLTRAGASPLGLSNHVLRAPTACLSGLSVLHALRRTPSQT